MSEREDLGVGHTRQTQSVESKHRALNLRLLLFSMNEIWKQWVKYTSVCFLSLLQSEQL